MTTRRGRSWGRAGPAPPGTVPVHSDAEARAAVLDAWEAGRPLPTLGLLGGDLCRTLGGRGDEVRLGSGAAARLPVDLGVATLDGAETVFVAHLVARRSWWRGRVYLAMNAEYLGRWDVAPRAHPNDGLLDTLNLNLRLGDRLKAWSRAGAGLHVPHPGIEERRVRAVSVRFERPTAIELDGTTFATAMEVGIRVIPDAFEVVV